MPKAKVIQAAHRFTAKTSKTAKAKTTRGAGTGAKRKTAATRTAQTGPARKTSTQTKHAKAKTTAATNGTNALWKLLEQKQKRMKKAVAEMETTRNWQGRTSSHRTNQKHTQYGRFAGPRRKAA